jgi:plexin A
MVFYNFRMSSKGENLLKGVNENDYKVWIGNNEQCNITSITMNLIACIIPEQSNLRDKSDLLLKKLKNNVMSFEVNIQLGQSFTRRIGLINYGNDNQFKYGYDIMQFKYIIIFACVFSFILFVSMIGCFAVLKRRQNRQIRQLKRMQTEFENLEMRVARECKEAFTELQMDIGELANTLSQTGAPFHDYQTYCMRILFPNLNANDKNCLTTIIDLRVNANNKENIKNGISMFSQLILNKKFLLTFIRTLEADTHSFLLQDRLNLASYISICLHDHLDYFTE